MKLSGSVAGMATPVSLRPRCATAAMYCSSDPRAPPPLRGVVLHLPDDLLPRADVGRPGEHAHPVDLRRNRAGLHPLQLGEERAEELELTGIAHLAVWPHRFEFGEQ